MGDKTRLKAPSIHKEDDFTMAGLNLDGFSDLRGTAVDLDLTGQCSLNVSGTGRVNIEVPTDIDVATSDALVVRDGTDECLRVDMFNQKVTICETIIEGPLTTTDTNIFGGPLTCVESDEFQVHDNIITLNKNQTTPFAGLAGIDIRVGNGIGDEHVGLQWNGAASFKRWEIQINEADPSSFKPVAWSDPSVNDGNLSRTDLLAGSNTIGAITNSLPNINPPAHDLQTILEAIDFNSSPPLRGIYYLIGSEVSASELDIVAHSPDQGQAIDLSSMTDNEFTNNVYIRFDGIDMLNNPTKVTGPTDGTFANDVARKTTDPNILVFNDDIPLCVGIIVQIVDHNIKQLP